MLPLTVPSLVVLIDRWFVMLMNLEQEFNKKCSTLLASSKNDDKRCKDNINSNSSGNNSRYQPTIFFLILYSFTLQIRSKAPDVIILTRFVSYY